MINGKYRFDPTKLHENHTKNLNAAKEAIDQGVSPIAIDNTNMSVSVIYPYWKYAKDNGYDVRIINPGDWEDGLVHNGKKLDWSQVAKDQSVKESLRKQLLERQKNPDRVAKEQSLPEAAINRFVDNISSITKITNKDMERHHQESLAKNQ
ncbi:MAG: hypothetical protein HC836_48995 [Richelia sp. RM2_1_2]|nr:hypothetical protein [Richelia sp. RM2_1_2]